MKVKKYTFFILMALFFTSCIVRESEYEIVTEEALRGVEIKIPFEDRTLERDDSGRIVSSREILESEGYEFGTDEVDSWIRNVTFNERKYEFNYPLYHTYLFDEYIVFFTGMIGIESGFFRYIITPKHSHLITFKRDDFEFVNKKIIMGIVRNVKLADGKLYFVVEKGNQRIYGRYPINDDD